MVAFMPAFCSQLQQVASAERGTGTEASAPSADCGKREDSQVAVHTAV